MIKRVFFKYEHLELIEARQFELDSVLSLENVRVMLQNMPKDSGAITIVIDGVILMCMGFWMPFQGVGEVWLLPSVHVEKHKIFFVREVKRYLEAVAWTFQWHRVQTVTIDDPVHRKWMRVLGFIEEGIMKRYLEKKDYIMSARFFDWGA